MNEPKYIAKLPVWYLQSESRGNPSEIYGGTSGSGNRFVAVFSRKDSAKRVGKQHAERKFKLVAINHAGYEGFLDLAEQRGYTHVTIDPTTDGAMVSIADLRGNMPRGHQDESG